MPGREAFLIFLLAAACCATGPSSQLPGGEVFVNSLGMKLLRIDPGSFDMGQAGGDPDELPVHRVEITVPFFMAATEVTNAQYEQFDPSHRRFRGIRGLSRDDDEAVTYVSWHEATRFCTWLSEREGRPYRLPTEAEWEFSCRAGTNTPFHTGDSLPAEYHRNQPVEGKWEEVRGRKDDDLRAKKGKLPVSLRVATTPASPWGMHEMHGNVEEWCQDWYGPYAAEAGINPVGPLSGVFKVSRGGSHDTYVRHLRSANRHSALPGDKHWILGFRIVLGEQPKGSSLPPEPLTLDDPSVLAEIADWPGGAAEPFFKEPIPFVWPRTEDPWLSKLSHHHCPSLTWCDNGDLLAVWFNTRSEIGREMVVLSSRLRRGRKEWDPSRLFFSAADRNMTGSCVLNDGKGKLYYFQGISESSHHRDQCMTLSVSLDSGRTWSMPRIISSLEERHKYSPMDSAFVSKSGSLVLSVDYAPMGHDANEAGGTIFVSPDGGETWIDRGTGKGKPEVREGGKGGITAGFHLGVVELNDGRLISLGRKAGIEGNATLSISNDMGESWSYHRSPFPDIGGGQRSVLMRLLEGPILFVSFTGEAGMEFPASGGGSFRGRGMFAALSYDEARTWPRRKLLTPGGPPREMDGGGNTHRFVMDAHRAEPKGYLAATQTPDRTIHLISSRLHYRFNLPWLESPNE